MESCLWKLFRVRDGCCGLSLLAALPARLRDRVLGRVTDHVREPKPRRHLTASHVHLMSPSKPINAGIQDWFRRRAACKPHRVSLHCKAAQAAVLV